MTNNIVAPLYSVDNIKAAIINCSYRSSNVKIEYYVHEFMLKHQYSIIQILKLIRHGEYSVIEPEHGRENSYGFTVAFMFPGNQEACHVRGWFDNVDQTIVLTDAFKCEYLSD